MTIRWRRWLWLLSAALLMLGGIVSLAVPIAWQRLEAAADLREAIQKLDAEEPDWRLEQIEARRRVVPDEENGALVVMAAHAKLPKNWTSKVLDDLTSTAPPTRLPDDFAARLREELVAVEPALAQARRLSGFRHGRYPLQYAPDFFSTLVTEQQNAREIAAVLQLDMFSALEDGNYARAWLDGRMLLNVGQTLGDEPLLITQLIRIALQLQAAEAMERTLAHGAVADAELAVAQRALAEERDENLFLTGIRGERAGIHAMLKNMAESDVPIPAALGSLSSGRKPTADWWDHVTDIFARRMVYRSHAWLLGFHTDVIRTAQEPGPEKYPKLAALARGVDADLRNADRDLILAKLLSPALLKIAEAEQRLDSHLECAIAGLAAERFRLKHQRWPASLDELVAAKLLERVPIDQFDGQPIRLRHAADGVVFYSIYKDGGKGDVLDRLDDVDPRRVRVEFRLWDPEHRRQPPLPPREREPEPRD